jgi:hypothetical protein
MLLSKGLLQYKQPSLLKKKLSDEIIAILGGSEDAPLYPIPSFQATLQTTLVPEFGSGSLTPTFTRASTAYVQDWEAIHRRALSGEARFQGSRRVNNFVVTSSRDVTSGYSFNNITTHTFDAGTGKSRLVPLGANSQFYQSESLISGHTYVMSVKVQSNNGASQTFNLYGQGGTHTSPTVTATTAEQRFSFTFTATATGAANCAWLQTSNAGDFLVWDWQIEDVTGQSNQNPSEYVSVGVFSAPYHGANVDGVKYFNTLNGNTVASNVVTEATGAPITSANGSALITDAGGPFGYLSEGARADVLGTTTAIRRTMTDVGWVSGGGGITVGAAVGADGVADAGASLTATGANGTILFTTVLGAAVRTYSALVRRKTGTGTVEMTKDGGTSWTALTLTTTYKQFQVVTASAANPVVGFRIVTDTDAIEVDFNTLEAATFANPTPIPVNVSKAGDVLTYPTSGNFNTSTGTAFAETLILSGTAGGRVIQDASDASWALVIRDSTKSQIFDGANSAITANAGSQTTVNKDATSWGGSTLRAVTNGGTIATGTFDGVMNMGANIAIGCNGAVVQLFGTIRRVVLWTKALASTLLIAKTRTL